MDPENKTKRKTAPGNKQPFPKKTMTLDHPIHIYCVFVLKIFQKGHGYFCQHCQMLNYTNASIWRKKRFRGWLAKTNYILTLKYECMCLGGLSWRVQWAFQMWEFPQLLKLTDGLTAGAITRNSGPVLPQFLWNVARFLAQELPPPCVGLQYSPRSSGPANRKHFHLPNWPLTWVHYILENLYLF